MEDDRRDVASEENPVPYLVTCRQCQTEYLFLCTKGGLDQRETATIVCEKCEQKTEHDVIAGIRMRIPGGMPAQDN